MDIRKNAKEQKDWATSDLIRDKLAALGFNVRHKVGNLDSRFLGRQQILKTAVYVKHLLQSLFRSLKSIIGEIYGAPVLCLQYEKAYHHR